MKYEPRDVNLVKQNEGADNNIVDEKGTSTATAKQPQLVQTRLEISYITGPRLWLVEYALLVSQFLIAMESSIVGTSIVSIANDFGSAGQAQLVFTIYLVCYACFISVIGSISEIIGRRTTFLASMFLFTIFSVVCGTSKSMVELIIFRAFQGLGASGIQAISIIIIPDLIPVPKLLKYSSFVSMALMLGLIVGLLLGGLISDEGSWRWVFYINGPCGATTLLAILALPWNHPPRIDLESTRPRSMIEEFRKVDWLGCLFLVLGSVPLIFALIEADVLVRWNNASIIVCLVLSGLSWVGLAVQQTFLFHVRTNIRPIVPVELFTKRFSLALLLSSFWFGFPYYGVMLTLPKRFTLVNSSSPMRASIQTLPMIAVVPFVITAVNMIIGRLTSKPKLVSLVALIVLVSCTIVQVISISVLTTAPSTSFPAGLYVALAFIGVGNGPYLGVSFSMMGKHARMATCVDPSVALGALNQCRILGGGIGLAVNARLLTSHILSTSSSVLSSEIRHGLARNPEVAGHLTSGLIEVEARKLLNEGFNHGFIFQACAAAIAFLAILLAFENHAV